MAYTNTKPLLEEIAFARKQYEKSMEAGDSAAADKHFSRVMDLKENLANIEKANEQHNLRYGTQETIDDIRGRSALRELRIQLGQTEGEAPQTKPKITGAGYRKPSGGGAPNFVPFDVLKANAEAAKAKLAAEKAALGETPKPKLATDGLDLIRQAKEKKFGRVEPSNVPPKSNTANIIPRQEAIDEARALEEQARLKAIADKQAYDERQLEKAASKKLKEEMRADKERVRRETAARTEAPEAKPERTAKEISAATPEEILGNYQPKLAQPAAEPIDTSASLRQAEADAEAKALMERQKEARAQEAADKANARAADIAKKKASMIEYGGKPTHVSNLSTGEIDRLLEEKGNLKPKDFGVRFNTVLKDTNEKHVAWKKHQAEKAALEGEQKARQERADAEAEKPIKPKVTERQAEQQRIIQAAKDEAARRNAPPAPVEQLGTPPPASTAAPSETQLSEKELRRQELMRQLQELDAPEAPKLAGATETVTTPEGLTLTKPASPASSGLTPEQLQSLAEAEAFDKQRGARPQQKGRIDNTPKQAGNPPRQTPPSRPGFMAVPSLDTMGRALDKTVRVAGMVGYGAGVLQHGPVEMAVSYGVPFTPWRYGIGPTLTLNAGEDDALAAARQRESDFNNRPKISVEERMWRLDKKLYEDSKKIKLPPEKKDQMPPVKDYSELVKNSELFKPRQ
jgi:hypothetical protein